MPTRFPDFLIVGGGVVGMALARRIKQQWSDAKITVLEKEDEVAQHASGRNSGVLHAGFYYPADSLKARLCVEGNRSLRAYCQEQAIPLNECGKLVVTRSEAELPALLKLYQRGLQNGVELQLLNQSQTKALDANAKTFLQAIYSPHTATVNPQQVCQSLKTELQAQGVDFSLGNAYLYQRKNWIHTKQGIYQPRFLINAAGLYADKIAKDFGFSKKYTLLPFKGMYLGYAGNSDLIRRHIYPVPDPRQPFLGVHLTKTAEGKLKLGPTAIPAFWREHYSGLENINYREMAEILWYESQLFISNSFGFRDLARSEMRKYARSYFAHLATHLAREIAPKEFTDKLKPGIRAQLLNKQTLELVQDFVIEGDSHSLHILNAVSPAFTSALSFANYLVENWLEPLK
jgi:(S)-2-hydroxyglutarate dehydrogenase